MQARYPHLEGRTGLSYSECGKYVFTCGDNGMVRRFLVGSPDVEPESAEILHNGLDIKVIPPKPGSNAQFAVCCDDGEAEIFDVESLAKKGTLFRTALPLRELNLSGDGKWCLVTGDDKCLIVNVEDITETKEVTDYPAKHASFHPGKNNVITVSTLDGVIRVLQLGDGKPEVLTELEMIVPAVKSADDNRSTAAKFSPQGEAIAIPSKTFEVNVVSTRDWLVSFRLKGHTNAITSLEWSPNGRYLASCGRDNRLLIFDTSTGGSIADYPLIDGCEIRWHPHSNEISATTYKGQLYVFEEAVPSNLTSPFGGEIFNPVEERDQKSASIENETVGDDLDKEEDLFLPSDVEGNDEDDLEIVDNSRGRASRYDSGYSNGSSSSKRQKFSISTYSQRPFQSGATPWLNQRRYLCMCPTGYVWTVRQDSSHHTVTINFFDQSTHREIHFQDTELFDLAGLTQQAAVFANSKSGEVHVRFHSMPADNWNIQINTKVDGPIQCLAISSQVVVIFTKHGYMRTYTVYGSPLFVSRTPSNVVCCAAGGENEVVYVCHNQSTNEYSYTFENMALFDLIYQKSAPLEITPQSQLKSLFFSEEGEPCVMDSKGILMTLLSSRKMGRAKWVPILGNPADMDESVQRKYWPISISEGKLLCAVLRGQLQYPPIPLPITDEIDLAVPGNEANDGSYLVARTLFQQAQSRVEFLGEHGVEVDDEIREDIADQSIELEKMLLRQFQQACEKTRINRALLLVQLIQGQECLQAAAKIAAAYGLNSLTERINEALE